jgi:hypothetical protein
MRFRHRRSWAAAVAASTLIATNTYLLSGDPPFGAALRLTLSLATLLIGAAVLAWGLRQARACATA